MEQRKKQPRDNSAALGQGPGATSRDTHNDIFELLYRARNPQQMEGELPEKASSF